MQGWETEKMSLDHQMRRHISLTLTWGRSEMKKKAAHAPAPNKPVDPDGIGSNSETSDKRSALQKLLDKFN